VQRGENPNQLLSGVIFSQNQAPTDEDHTISLESNDYVCQDFYFPARYTRGLADAPNTPELTGIQLLVAVEEGFRTSAALDWRVQFFDTSSQLGWETIAEGTSVQSHVEGEEVWYDLLFDEGINPPATTLEERWRFCIRGRVTSGDVLTPVVYEDGVAIIPGYEVPVALFPGRPHPFDLNGVPSILYLDPDDEQVYYSVQQGISRVWASAPNPLVELGLVVHRDTYDMTPITVDGQEASLLFRVMGAVGDEGTDFLGNTYREAVRRNYVTNVESNFGGDAETYWLSKPNPSRFGVESIYFDVRDNAGNASVLDQVLVDPITPGVYFQVYYAPEEIVDGVVRYNYVLNPSFATSTNGWTSSGLDGLARDTGIYHIPQASLKLTSNTGGTAYAYYRVTDTPDPGNQDDLENLKGRTVTLSAWVQKAAGWALDSGDDIVISLTDGIQVSDGGSFAALQEDAWERVSVTLLVSDEATTLEARLHNGGDGIVYWDGVLLEEGGRVGGYFAGEQYIPPPAPDSIHEWEERVWTHIPKTFQMVKRDSHVLPEPITTKYVKVEFSHLQPRSYNSGDFPQPIAYKKHPKWVLDYFVARTALDQYEANGSNFSPRRVGVTFDALDLAYNYYLDDLNQEPNQPVLIQDDERRNFITELSTATVGDVADQDVLAQISTVFDNFKTHPALKAVSYLPSISATNLYGQNYPTEYADLPSPDYDTSALQSLDKTAVVYEATMPVMYFFIPCRHRYKELVGSLKYNRAYFAGVKQVAFGRERYTADHDSNLYVETMGDEINMERMDFIRVGEGSYVTRVE
jgi:hypothetical protein